MEVSSGRTKDGNNISVLLEFDGCNDDVDLSNVTEMKTIVHFAHSYLARSRCDHLKLRRRFEQKLMNLDHWTSKNSAARHSEPTDNYGRAYSGSPRDPPWQKLY